jgi:hypothetical protein
VVRQLARNSELNVSYPLLRDAVSARKVHGEGSDLQESGVVTHGSLCHTQRHSLQFKACQSRF